MVLPTYLKSIMSLHEAQNIFFLVYPYNRKEENEIKHGDEVFPQVVNHHGISRICL